MAECSSAVVFLVNVLLNMGDSLRNIVRNSIHKTSTKNSWYDLFEEVTQQIDESPDIPRSVWNDFEKLASISVPSSQNGEQFQTVGLSWKEMLELEETYPCQNYHHLTTLYNWSAVKLILLGWEGGNGY